MAVIEEFFDLDGQSHVRHYSDSGFMIASDDGIEYEIAEDITSLGKVYHETNTLVNEDNILSGDDILNALEEIL